jgi:hypothetical protein
MTRRTLALIALALTLVGGSAACARRAATPPIGSPPSPSTGASTSTPPGTPPGPGTQLPGALRLTRTGGLAGVNQAITIQPNGAWSYSTEGTVAQSGTLDPAQTAALRALVTDPVFRTELSQVEPDPNCADGFKYTLSIAAESAAWEDCGGAPRPSLDRTIDLITQATPF